MEGLCFNHPEQVSTATCHMCGRPYCGDCLTAEGERFYCSSTECQAAMTMTLPDVLDCPVCSTTLSLTDAEQASRIVHCPVCKKQLNYTRDSGSRDGVTIEELPEREYAAVLTRFGSLVIDSLLLVPFSIPIMILSEQGSEPPPSLILILLLGMFGFGFWNGIYRMGKTGQSLGRKFLNIAVLDEGGNPIGVAKAFLRESIGRWVSGLVCYIGYLNAFWDNRKQMWHDKMANCYVFYVHDKFS